MEACLRLVVVTPTYNNAATLINVLDRVIDAGWPLIVVNDGCTDNTASLLEQWSAESHRQDVHVLAHDHNRGKADALQTGFAHAERLGYTHIATIDTDGQHDPEDIIRLWITAQQNPQALVIGARRDDLKGYPARSLIGRRLSNLGIAMACGARVFDSQSGLRIYPTRLVHTVHCRTGRFAFETEIITRSCWAGWPMSEVEITSRYLSQTERVSHFRPWSDSLRCIGLHTRMITRALLPVRHQTTCPDALDTSKKQSRSWWQRLWHWMSPSRLIAQLREVEAGRLSVASGLATGAFIANLPTYGLHTILSLYVARRLHLHPLPVVAGSHLSTPPIGPLLILAAVAIGHLMLTGAWPNLRDFDAIRHNFIQQSGLFLLAWTLGSLVIGLICMIVTWVGSLALMRLIPPAQRTN